MRQIFRSKKPDGVRIQGWLTKEGAQLFEVGRRRLAKLAKLGADQVSDGDTAEFLARGEADTKRYIREVHNGKA
jgi:hypothetical protein